MSSSSYLPVMAAFWVGPYLSWLEQIGMLSFVRHGHRVILYAHNEVKNVPPGIEVRPSQDIWDENELKLFHKKEDRASMHHPLVIHSDFFRWNLQLKKDYIYIDGDRFCCKPISFLSREDIALRGLAPNVTFFRLPQNSPTAKLALRILSQKYPVPGWISKKDQWHLRWLKITGRGVPITHMRWGSAGDRLLNWALEKTGEAVNRTNDFIFDLSIEREKLEYLFHSPPEFEAFITEKHHMVLYNWPRINVYMPEKFLTHPPENSWIGRQAADLGVIPSDAPVIETRQKNIDYFGIDVDIKKNEKEKEKGHRAAIGRRRRGINW